MGMRTYVLGAVLLFLSVPASTQAAPILLDFEALRHEDALVIDVGTTFSDQGFMLTADQPCPCSPDVFRTLGTLHPGYAGSTALSQGVSNGMIMLSRPDGGAFDLLSISFAEHPSVANLGEGLLVPVDGGPFSIEVTGVRQDNSMISALVPVDSFLTLTPYAFEGFTALQSVYWFQGPGGTAGPTHQFDDIVVAPVPEPATLLLLSTGFAGLEVLRRRRDKGTRA